MIRIIAVGRVTEDYLKQGIRDYEQRIPTPIEWIEIADEANAQGRKREGERILKRIRNNDYVACLDIKGKAYTSESFASFLDGAFTYHGGDLVFVIGGSYGLDQSVLERADRRISFSNMTFPHRMFRLILVEQIYRGMMILKNHPYHK